MLGYILTHLHTDSPSYIGW